MTEPTRRKFLGDVAAAGGATSLGLKTTNAQAQDIIQLGDDLKRLREKLSGDKARDGIKMLQTNDVAFLLILVDLVLEHGGQDIDSIWKFTHAHFGSLNQRSQTRIIRFGKASIINDKRSFLDKLKPVTDEEITKANISDSAALVQVTKRVTGARHSLAEAQKFSKTLSGMNSVKEEIRKAQAEIIPLLFADIVGLVEQQLAKKTPGAAEAGTAITRMVKMLENQ